MDLFKERCGCGAIKALRSRCERCQVARVAVEYAERSAVQEWNAGAGFLTGRQAWQCMALGAMVQPDGALWTALRRDHADRPEFAKKWIMGQGWTEAILGEDLIVLSGLLFRVIERLPDQFDVEREDPIPFEPSEELDQAVAEALKEPAFDDPNPNPHLLTGAEAWTWMVAGQVVRSFGSHGYYVIRAGQTKASGWMLSKREWSAPMFAREAFTQLGNRRCYELVDEVPCESA